MYISIYISLSLYLYIYIYTRRVDSAAGYDPGYACLWQTKHKQT